MHIVKDKVTSEWRCRQEKGGVVHRGIETGQGKKPGEGGRGGRERGEEEEGELTGGWSVSVKLKNDGP